MHEFFDHFPADYTPLALATDPSVPVTYTGTDVTTGGSVSGSPYIMVSGGGISITSNLSLAPPTQTLTAGTSGTVTATLVDSTSAPVANASVVFDVTAGPDAGQTFTGTTDSSGQVAFTYTNSGTAGTDQIVATYTNPDSVISQGTASITWTAPVATDTSITTSLSGGGQSGGSITVPTGTAVTDSASLSGTNASSATGSVTYNVYSDPNCTTLVSGPDNESITTPGTMPASQPVTLTTPGTYYWQATYNGDSMNNGSTSACGSETETVTATGTDADLVVTMSAPSTNQAGSGFPVSVTVTNDGPATSNNIVVGLLVPKALDILNQGNAKKIGRLLGWFHTPLAAGDSVTYTVWLCSTTTDSGKTLIPAAALSLSTPDPNYLNNIAADVVTFTPAAGTMKVGLAHASYRSLVLLAALRADGRVLKAHGTSTKSPLRSSRRVVKAHSRSTRH